MVDRGSSGLGEARSTTAAQHTTTTAKHVVAVRWEVVRTGQHEQFSETEDRRKNWLEVAVIWRESRDAYELNGESASKGSACAMQVITVVVLNKSDNE